MSNYFSSDFTLGILGGGQLGKMLLVETRKLDIKTCVLAPDKDAPSRLDCDSFLVGDLMDYDTVLAFGEQADLITTEIESINIDALETLEKQGKKVYPSSKTLRTIQSKSTQKLFYQDHEIPTAPFSRFAHTSEIKTALYHEALAFPFVWKSARFGYDGQGVKVVRVADDLDKLPNVECIVEDFIPFKNELAVIVARNPSGKVVNYPVVEMEFHPQANQVEYVICPARIPESMSKKAVEIALKVSDAFQHVGLLAVEMFQTQNDEILVNEVAPRPHNSGHYSIEGSYTSQYQQHIRAILNLPLGNTESKLAAVMVNLVGQEGYQGNVIYKGIENILTKKGVSVHIYGKKTTRAFRKMGHVTVVAKKLSEARATAQVIKNSIEVIS